LALKILRKRKIGGPHNGFTMSRRQIFWNPLLGLRTRKNLWGPKKQNPKGKKSVTKGRERGFCGPPSKPEGEKKRDGQHSKSTNSKILGNAKQGKSWPI